MKKALLVVAAADRKSTRLNSSHSSSSYAVFCLKKKRSDGFEIEAIGADIEDLEGYRETLARIFSAPGAPGVVVYNAALPDPGEILDTTVERLRTAHDVDVLGAVVAAFFFNDTPPTEIYTLSLHDALPILGTEGLAELRTRIAKVPDPSALLDKLANDALAEHRITELEVAATLYREAGKTDTDPMAAYAEIGRAHV